jgi:hypothetical protein
MSLITLPNGIEIHEKKQAPTFLDSDPVNQVRISISQALKHHDKIPKEKKIKDLAMLSLVTKQVNDL